ncbi:MAG: cobalamin-dependent protein, partial [Armatimonadota bacterium]|nr:cobalamin-dependent protein [Armatimonadota bacterium]
MDNQAVASVINARGEQLAERVVERHYALEPEVWERYGEKGRQRSLQDARYHLSYLAEALAADDPILFVNYVNWCKVLFHSIRLPADALEKTLRLTEEVLAEELPAAASTAAAVFIGRALEALPDAPCDLPSCLEPNAPCASLARSYLDALLRGERQQAVELITAAAERGVPVRDLYLHVFQPVQHEVGRLWQMNQLSVAQEHFCTAVTQLVMSLLYPRVFASEKNGLRLVATCVSGELHEIGARMVADLFEMEGWDTYYLGANTPADSVVRAVADRRAHVLAISATMTFHLGRVADLVAAVRSATTGVKILVGGYPFNVSENLWRQVGAD